MVQLVSTTHNRRSFLSHLVVATVLVLVFLVGIVPFGSALVGTLCVMECYAGLVPHVAVRVTWRSPLQTQQR